MASLCSLGVDLALLCLHGNMIFAAYAMLILCRCIIVVESNCLTFLYLSTYVCVTFGASIVSVPLYIYGGIYIYRFCVSVCLLQLNYVVLSICHPCVISVALSAYLGPLVMPVCFMCGSDR